MNRTTRDIDVNGDTNTIETLLSNKNEAKNGLIVQKHRKKIFFVLAILIALIVLIGLMIGLYFLVASSLKGEI
jgi:hypothetical protein